MSYDSDISFEYFAPTKVIFGIGSMAELPMAVASLGTKALLVTDAGLTDSGLVDGIQEKLGDLLVAIYDDVPQDSGMDVVDRGAELAHLSGADVIVSLGGGSFTLQVVYTLLDNP